MQSLEGPARQIQFVTLFLGTKKAEIEQIQGHGDGSGHGFIGSTPGLGTCDSPLLGFKERDLGLVGTN